MTSRTTRALILIVLAIALPAHADTRKAKKHYERGMAAYMIEQYDEAIRAFEEGFKEKPLPQFIFNIALSHEKARRFEEAAKYFQKFIDSWPDSKDRPDAERHLAAVRDAMRAPTAEPPPPTANTPDTGTPAPPRPALTPSDSGPLAPSFMLDEPATGKAAPSTPRRWPIWVGVAVGVVAVGVGAGLAIGLTRDHTNVLGAESLR